MRQAGHYKNINILLKSFKLAKLIILYINFYYFIYSIQYLLCYYYSDCYLPLITSQMFS